MATPAFTDFQPFVPLTGFDIGDLYFSFLSKRTHDLVMHGFNQVRHHRPFISLHERFDRHPGHQLDGPEPSNLVIRNLDADDIIGLVRLSFDQQ